MSSTELRVLDHLSYAATDVGSMGKSSWYKHIFLQKPMKFEQQLKRPDSSSDQWVIFMSNETSSKEE